MTDPEVTDDGEEPADGADEGAVPWRPLSVRRTGDATAYDTLFDGVPEHLAPSLQDWITSAAKLLRTSASPVHELCQRLNRRTRRTIAISNSSEGLRAKPGEELEVIDGLLRMLFETYQGLSELAHPTFDEVKRADRLLGAAARLNLMLDEAGSLWTVRVLTFSDGERLGLSERVAEVAREQADLVLDGESPASIHLRRAWTALYGRHPAYATALDEAGKAIESAAFPVICPQNAKATLTTAARELSDGAAKGKWTCAFGTLEQVADRMRAVYTAQQRHGVAAVAEMKVVDRPEAEAAVHEAITLVQWFRSGVVARVEAAS